MRIVLYSIYCTCGLGVGQMLDSGSFSLTESLIETEGLWSPVDGTAECPIRLLMEEGRPAPSSVHSNMVRPKMRNMR